MGLVSFGMFYSKVIHLIKIFWFLLSVSEELVSAQKVSQGSGVSSSIVWVWKLKFSRCTQSRSGLEEKTC